MMKMNTFAAIAFVSLGSIQAYPSKLPDALTNGDVSEQYENKTSPDLGAAPVAQALSTVTEEDVKTHCGWWHYKKSRGYNDKDCPRYFIRCKSLKKCAEECTAKQSTCTAKCLSWCHGHSAPWSRKCTWHTNECSGCAPCPDAMESDEAEADEVSEKSMESDEAEADEVSEKSASEQEWPAYGSVTFYKCPSWFARFPCDWKYCGEDVSRGYRDMYGEWHKSVYKEPQCRALFGLPKEGCPACPSSQGGASCTSCKRPAPPSRCEGWCFNHGSAWKDKCSWNTNACSGCPQCKKWATLVYDGGECRSPDTGIGSDLGAHACSEKCRATPGCRYFIHGRGVKWGRCYWERTSRASCPEGWESDNFDFYKLGDDTAP